MQKLIDTIVNAVASLNLIPMEHLDAVMTVANWLIGVGGTALILLVVIHKQLQKQLQKDGLDN